jgi:hypothetical protein
MPNPSNTTTARSSTTPHEDWQELPAGVWAVGIVVGFGFGMLLGCSILKCGKANGAACMKKTWKLCKRCARMFGGMCSTAKERAQVRVLLERDMVMHYEENEAYGPAVTSDDDASDRDVPAVDVAVPLCIAEVGEATC